MRKLKNFITEYVLYKDLNGYYQLRHKNINTLLFAAILVAIIAKG